LEDEQVVTIQSRRKIIFDQFNLVKKYSPESREGRLSQYLRSNWESLTDPLILGKTNRLLRIDEVELLILKDKKVKSEEQVACRLATLFKKQEKGLGRSARRSIFERTIKTKLTKLKAEERSYVVKRYILDEYVSLDEAVANIHPT
jgi:hypothetical protein